MTQPIDELPYTLGTTVVDIGDYRISRGMSRRDASGCPHKRLSYDSSERRIWCRDCEHTVEAFDALIGMVESFDAALKGMEKREATLADAEAAGLVSLAAREIDKAWRKRASVPACPHCHNGLFPEDFKNGVSSLGREYAKARRAKR
jgi:hypothetical protein